MGKFIPVYEPDLSGNELRYVTECVRTSWVSSIGEYVVRFEKEFSRFCGTKYAISVANGTVALHLALKTLGIGPGDEVLVPTLTFVATASAVVYTGAQPIFVDSERDTWNIDPRSIGEKITPRTKAIIPVHLYGHPADMDLIMALARQYNLFVIEDAAEAHGAEYEGKRVGSLGDIGCFSFYGNKIITTGEGGMLVMDNGALMERARFLKDHAMSKERRYWHPEVGFNYRLTNLQAALGVAQLERINEIIAAKRENARYYNSLLKGVEGIALPPEANWAKNVYWMYSILIEDEFGVSRDRLMQELRIEGIDSRPFFYPIHTMPSYRTGEVFPVAEELSRKGINLPSAATLKTDDIERVVSSILKIRTKR